MNTHEGRLRAMIDPDTGRGWSLNDEDRAAITWMIAAFEKVKAEWDQVRREWGEASHREYEWRQRIERAARELMREIG